MLAQWIIENKRDGKPLSAEEIRFFIKGYTSGAIPDYQMAAFAMAVFFRGMTFKETTILTDAMMRSGQVMDLSSVKLPKVDKHSTGGVGDKTSIILAPLVACCGIAVPMISGRGLGITGGTLDKLESIPGYRTAISSADFARILRKCGCSMIGQTAELAPADRKLYSLRDVTGTVPSIPLIASSIMSKKLAEGADALVMDVKWGKGAFMKQRQTAMELASTIVNIGRRMNRKMAAVITDMNQPIGRSAGNAVEIIECLETLKGQGPEDLVELTLELGSRMLVMGKVSGNTRQAKEILRKKLSSGEAFEKFKEMVHLHGGRTDVLDNPSKLPTARLRVPYHAAKSGYITTADAELIGRACVVLGAGRKTIKDSIDHSAGITSIVKIGEKVVKGQPLLVLHANYRRRITEAQNILKESFLFSSKRISPPRLITGIIT